MQPTAGSWRNCWKAISPTATKACSIARTCAFSRGGRCRSFWRRRAGPCGPRNASICPWRSPSSAVHSTSCPRPWPATCWPFRTPEPTNWWWRRSEALPRLKPGPAALSPRNRPRSPSFRRSCTWMKARGSARTGKSSCPGSSAARARCCGLRCPSEGWRDCALTRRIGRASCTCTASACAPARRCSGNGPARQTGWSRLTHRHITKWYCEAPGRLRWRWYCSMATIPSSNCLFPPVRWAPARAGWTRCSKWNWVGPCRGISWHWPR